MKFRNTEWAPDTHPEMVAEVRDFVVPAAYGNTLGALIDGTPSECISRVFLEDKMFETLFHNRTVLIGDGKDGSR